MRRKISTGRSNKVNVNIGLSRPSIENRKKTHANMLVSFSSSVRSSLITTEALETYFGRGTLVDHRVGKLGETESDPSLQRAGSELRTLLERFANGKSIGDILDAADQLNTDVKDDEALGQWFRELDAFVRYVISSKRNTDANPAWFLARPDDPLDKDFREDWRRLTKDLLFAEDGSLSFKPHLWTDIRKVIIPQLGYIMKDSGLAEVFLGGEGLKIKVRLIEAVCTGLEFLDEQLVGVRDRYEEARKSEDINGTKALASLFERKSGEVSPRLSRGSQMGTSRSHRVADYNYSSRSSIWIRPKTDRARMYGQTRSRASYEEGFWHHMGHTRLTSEIFT
ncbi:hypothetical protein BS47DRAFT_1357029 [Hydnum rufescens UP504]|uniref:HAM1-like N-terminal domain-containing protein n=1 Tax=Hydnum rufescens UP504 TaxID=1448309 RepID=A0A9P6BBS2_9AGAM|nr:hypothetical protein BS47DRAFT_1357029 [Hydnum rufescens UP504]